MTWNVSGSGPWLKIKFELKYNLDFHKGHQLKAEKKKKSRTELHSLPLSHI